MKLPPFLLAFILVLAAASPRTLVDGSDRDVPAFRRLVQQKDPTCVAHKACNRTSGTCCPTPGGTYLSCCFEGLKSEKYYCNDRIDNDGNGLIDCDDPACFDSQGCILKRLNPKCTENKVCKKANLTGLCCPTSQGVYLDCCKQGLKSEKGFCSDGLDNDGNGKVDCADRNCTTDPACLNLQPQCSRNSGCTAVGLNSGSCCPTPSGQYLACCAVGATKSEKGLCSDGVDNDGDGKIDCNDSECKSENVCIFKGLNPKCSRNKNCTNLSGLCCPTVDGVYLDCCRGSL